MEGYMSKAKELPELNYLKECFSYNKLTGVIRWKKRPISHFSSESSMKSFNTRFAGNKAGCLSLDGYLQVRVKNQIYKIHRICFFINNGVIDERQVDHINHNKLDNSANNLRLVSDLGNRRNMPKQINNKSGVTGVYWSKDRLKWFADISINGKTIALGRYEDFNDAVIARKNAESFYGFHSNHGKATN